MKKHLLLLILLMACTALIPHAKAQAAEPLKIAGIYSLTGEYADIQVPVLKGLRFAIEEVNANGGVLGRQVDLILIDNFSTALGSREAVRIALDKNVVAVLGCSLSSHSLAIAPVLQKAGIPMITPESTHSDITKVGNYIFRTCFDDDFQGLIMAEFARKELKAATAVVLTNTGNQYSIDLARSFIKGFKDKKGTILWEGDFLMGSTDLDAMLSRVKKANPSVIYLPGYVDDSARIIKLAREKGIEIPFLGGDGWDDLMFKIAGDALHECFYTVQWHKNSTNPHSRAFVKAWEKRFGTVESAWIAPSYDAVMLLADAIKRAGSTKPSSIRKALEETNHFKGVTGDITFDANRNPVNKPAVILKFEQGTSHYIKTFSRGK